MKRTLAALMLLGGCGWSAWGSWGCASAAGRRLPSDPPRLSISPQVSFAPVEVRFTLRLTHAETLLERFYCPAVAWEYGDGGASKHEADCEPWALGSEPQPAFYARHWYRRGGTYLVRVSLFKTGERVLLEEGVVQVQPGLGEVN